MDTTKWVNLFSIKPTSLLNVGDAMAFMVSGRYIGLVCFKLLVNTDGNGKIHSAGIVSDSNNQFVRAYIDYSNNKIDVLYFGNSNWDGMSFNIIHHLVKEWFCEVIINNESNEPIESSTYVRITESRLGA